MTYEAEISRTNPTAFVFLIDQSGSMADPWGGHAKDRKADGVAVTINRLLQNFVIRAVRTEGVRNYYHVAVLRYGNKVTSGLVMSKEELVPIGVIADHPIRVEETSVKKPDGTEKRAKVPIWFTPIADGGTPMREAIRRAVKLCDQWIKQYPSCYPPTVINITDGEATDAKPPEMISVANELKNLASQDGNVLLLNIHISSQTANPIEYPDTDLELPDEFARLLFGMSSALPKPIQDVASTVGYKMTDKSRGFVFNADPRSLVNFLKIGTQPKNLR